MAFAGGGERRFLIEARLETDQPRESVYLQRPTWIDGVTFWTVTNSVRHWSMHHDTFTAALFLGPSPSARAKWCSRGEERNVVPGEVQLMSPGETHRTIAVSEPASFFVVWWEPGALKEASRELGAGGDLAHFAHAQLAVPDVADAMRRLHRAVNEQANPLELEERYIEATQLILEHASASTRSRLGRHHPSVRRAKELLHESFARNVSLDDLAKATRLSKFHLARCFREHTGMAPHQYQKLLRLQAARRLLETGETVRGAASRSGFADASHLTRAFRDWLGVAPGQWAVAHGIAG